MRQTTDFGVWQEPTVVLGQRFFERSTKNRLSQTVVSEQTSLFFIGTNALRIEWQTSPVEGNMRTMTTIVRI